LTDNFKLEILNWHKSIDRSLPWKKTNDPYKIWLSEILLQQTRVAQAMPYYFNFIEAFPSISDMANAEIDQILKLWQGLGYYSRARNMHASAKYVHFDLDGQFPNNYDDLLKLKGVGPYTAAAISSFAFGIPKAVLDGNVFRVLSRFFGIQTAIDSSKGKKEFQALADECLFKEDPAAYNQAIMDFGAIQCVPNKPDCPNCPLEVHCNAWNNNLVQQLPIKEKKVKKRTRYFNYLILNYAENVLIEKRNEKDIWQGLYQFPLIESNKEEFLKDVQETAVFKQMLSDKEYSIDSLSKTYKHLLTHQTIYARFISLSLTKPITDKRLYLSCRWDELKKFAVPRLIDCFLNDKMLTLKI